VRWDGLAMDNISSPALHGSREARRQRRTGQSRDKHKCTEVHPSKCRCTDIPSVPRNKVAIMVCASEEILCAEVPTSL
jgi:hypothetical protein